MQPIKLFAPALAALSAAEVHIYYGTDSGSGGIDGTNYEVSGFWFFDGPPNCRDVGRAVMSVMTNDASSAGTFIWIHPGSGPPADWDVRQLEWHVSNGQGNDPGMGHHTIRQHDDYEIVPAEHGMPRGWCRQDSDHDFRCAVGAASSDVTGTRLFICDTDLEPVISFGGDCNTKRCLVDTGYCDEGGC